MSNVISIQTYFKQNYIKGNLIKNSCIGRCGAGWYEMFGACWYIHKRKTDNVKYTKVAVEQGIDMVKKGSL